MGFVKIVGGAGPSRCRRRRSAPNHVESIVTGTTVAKILRSRRRPVVVVVMVRVSDTDHDNNGRAMNKRGIPPDGGGGGVVDSSSKSSSSSSSIRMVRWWYARIGTHNIPHTTAVLGWSPPSPWHWYLPPNDSISFYVPSCGRNPIVYRLGHEMRRAV